MDLDELTLGRALILEVRRSTEGLEVLTDLTVLSTERCKFCNEEGESASDLAIPLLTLLIRGVTGVELLGVPFEVDLVQVQIHHN